MRRPIVTTLCGSSRFKDEHERAQWEETLLGKIVIPMGMYGHVEKIDMDGEVKRKLDLLHLRKIDISDEVFLVNPDGYVGPSTLYELLYASQSGKTIFAIERSRVVLSESVPDADVAFWRKFIVGLRTERPEWLTT